MEQPPRQRVGGQRPGGRAARVRDAVLVATAELLAATPYDALRIEDVAVRAGVNKTTVYRRWPDKAALVADAARARSASAVPVPDTGSLVGDLVAFGQAVADNLSSDIGGRLTRTLVTAAATSAEVADEAPRFLQERLGGASAMIERAVARNEIAPGLDASLLIETLIGPLFVRLLVTGEPITRAVAEQVAVLVAAGAAAIT